MNGKSKMWPLAARRLVRPHGSVRFIYASARLPELMLALHGAGLPVVRVRPVHAKPNEPAYAVLTESIPESKRPFVLDPPLIVHRPEGGFSPEVEELLTKKA